MMLMHFMSVLMPFPLLAPSNVIYFRLGRRELISLVSITLYLSLVVRKPVFGVSDQVRHKPGCTATEDG